MVYLNYNTDTSGNITSSDSLYGADEFEIAEKSTSSVYGARVKFLSNGLQMQHDDVRIYNTAGGSTNPQPTLRIFGKTRSNSFLSISDDRYKHNETTITNALETIRKVVPKTYDKTAEKLPANYMGDLNVEYNKESGVIAQELAEIDELAHLVAYPSDPDEPYAVNYNNLLAYAIAAIKELDAKVSELQGHNN